MNQNLVPVTLISGFLGSGKTTLMNHLLRSHWNNEQVGIIVNDFGKVSLDDQLIEKRTKDILSLRNGCVCCSLLSSLQRTIETLTIEHNVKAIVMETSGITDPLQVKRIFQDYSSVKDRIVLNTVITVVDALNYQRFVNEILVLRNQTEAAGLLLLNKVDLVDKEKLKQVEQLLRSHNPEALILRAVYAKVDPCFMFHHGSVMAGGDRHESNSKENKVLPFSFKGLSTFLYESEHSLDREKFEHFAENLPDGLYRSKGIVYLSGNDHPLLFQFVLGQFSIEKPQTNTIIATKTQLVFIGIETLDQDNILKQLQSAETH